MRLTPGQRIVLGGASTAVALGLVLSYPTSTGQSVSTSASSRTVVVSAAPAPSTSTPVAPAPAAPTPAAPTPAAPAPSTSTPAAPTPAAPAPVTYTGGVAATRWGDVQVAITVTGGQVVSATAVRAPDSDRESRQINAQAIPVLEQATVSTTTAAIDTVSGATITSGGYRASLQSALDQAAL